MDGKTAENNFLSLIKATLLEILFVVLLLFIIFGTLTATNVIHLNHLPFFASSPSTTAIQTNTGTTVDTFIKQYDSKKAHTLLYDFISKSLLSEYVPSQDTSTTQNFFVSKGIIVGANGFQMAWAQRGASFSAFLTYAKGTNTPQKIIIFVNNLAPNPDSTDQIKSGATTLHSYFKNVPTTSSCSKYVPSFPLCQISSTSNGSLYQYGTYILPGKAGSSLKVYACRVFSPAKGSTTSQCVNLGI